MITIQTEFASGVVETNRDAFTKSYIENGNTIIEFDMRRRDYQKAFGIISEISRKEGYHVDVHEFSTFHSPIVYRFVLAQGYYSDEQGNRIFFTPETAEVSTRQHMSKNIIRVCCFLAVICGVSLRNIALIFKWLFSVPVTKSAIKRRIDEIGGNLFSEEEILKKLIEVKTPTQCHIDGCYPLGTDKCATVVKDDFDRILITHETDSESSEEAKKFLGKLKDTGIKITSVFSDYSKGSAKAVREVFPDAEYQADHFHTVKAVWKHLRKALLEYRRNLKSEGEKNENKEMPDTASMLWERRRLLLKKPSNLSGEERREIELPEKRDVGFIAEFRSVIRQIINIFDFSNTEVQAEIKLKMLKNQIGKTGAFKSWGTLFCPVGTCENSPPIHWRDRETRKDI